MALVLSKLLKVNVGDVGEKTQLSVRPERVSLGSEGEMEKMYLLVR